METALLLAKAANPFRSLLKDGIHRIQQGIRFWRNRRASATLDLWLRWTYQANRRRTLILDAREDHVTEISSRYAQVIGAPSEPEELVPLFRKSAPSYDQVLVIGHPILLKAFVESGDAQGIAWDTPETHLIPNGGGFSENWRRYLQWRMGPSCRIRGLFGLPGAGVPLLVETEDTIRLRRLSKHDGRLRHLLFGPETASAPLLFHFDPDRVLIKLTPGSDITRGADLMVSDRSGANPTPLARHPSPIRGKLLDLHQAIDALATLGYPPYVPQSRWPCLAIYSYENTFEMGGWQVTPELIQEGLYENFSLASELTGRFRIRRIDDTLKIEIQRKPGAETAIPAEELEESVRQYVPLPLEVCPMDYEDFFSRLEKDDGGISCKDQRTQKVVPFPGSD